MSYPAVITPQTALPARSATAPASATAPQQPTVDVRTLAPGRAVQLPRASGPWLQVVSGVVWLTRSGDGEDYFLQAGEWLRIGAGRVVLECTSAAPATYSLHRTKP